MDKNKIILTFVVGCASLLVYYIFKNRFSSKSGYLYMGSPFSSFSQGSGREFNEECMEHPGYRFCTLTDGSAGVCGNSGMCVKDLSMDHSKDQISNGADVFKTPICYEPVFKEGCNRFCNCKIMDGAINENELGQCIENCETMFYPA